jgi:hypothetical protein
VEVKQLADVTVAAKDLSGLNTIALESPTEGKTVKAFVWVKPAYTPDMPAVTLKTP